MCKNPKPVDLVSDFLCVSHRLSISSTPAMPLSLSHSPTSFPSEFITTLLCEECVATLRRRRMPMERLVWAIIGIAIFRNIPMAQLVNQLDILLPSDRPSPQRLPASSAKTRVQEHQASVSRNRSTMFCIFPLVTLCHQVAGGWQSLVMAQACNGIRIPAWPLGEPGEQCMT